MGYQPIYCRKPLIKANFSFFYLVNINLFCSTVSFYFLINIFNKVFSLNYDCCLKATNSTYCMNCLLKIDKWDARAIF